MISRRIIFFMIYLGLTAGLAAAQEPMPRVTGSNINFYQSSNFISAVGVGYSF